MIEGDSFGEKKVSFFSPESGPKTSVPGKGQEGLKIGGMSLAICGTK